MASNKWFNTAVKYPNATKVTGSGPADIRTVCVAKSDLIDPRTFTADYVEGLDPTYYKGMTVALQSDGSVWVLIEDIPWKLKEAPSTFDSNLTYYSASTEKVASPQPTGNNWSTERTNYKVVDTADYSAWMQQATKAQVDAVASADKYVNRASGIGATDLQIATGQHGADDLYVPYAAQAQYGVTKVNSQVTLGTGESIEVPSGTKDNSKIFYVQKAEDGQLVVRVPIDLIDEPIWEDENSAS